MKRASWMVASWVVLVAGCRPPPRMCSQDGDCGAQAACVAGRCVAHGANPAIDSARRMVVRPADVGYVSRSAAPGASVATLAKTADPSLALLRFELALPPEVSVLEAYVVLSRVASVDDDASGVALHAARVIAPWDSASLSWARQPAIEETGSPITRLLPGSGPFVRLDVRDLVQRWRRRSRDELGVAIVADATSPTGIAVALAPTDVARDRGDPLVGGPGAVLGPSLEVYVK